MTRLVTNGNHIEIFGETVQNVLMEEANKFYIKSKSRKDTTEHVKTLKYQS